MGVPARLAAFALALAAVFGLAVVAGAALDPDSAAPERSAHTEDDTMDDHATGDGNAATHGARDAPAGLAVAQDGLRLVAERTTFTAGAQATLRFRIADARGATVAAFDREHDKRLHLIAVRRDLTGYQHLHPAQRADGAWEIPVRFTEPGTHRLFADFTPHGGQRTTLGIDVLVDGDARYVPLPAPTRLAHVDGYDIALTGDLAAGTTSTLRFTVSRDGAPVDDLEPYLGARGHLVALREGDLAYLHVHPQDAAGGGHAIAFAAELPSAARYRLFLQFQRDGRVHTAEFTQEVR